MSFQAPHIPPPPPRQSGRSDQGVIIGVVVAILAVVVLAGAAGAYFVMRKGKDDDKAASTSGGPSKPAATDLPKGVRYAKTSDVAVIRKSILGTGYKIVSDDGRPELHTFAVQKLPCSGTITIMAMADAKAAKGAAGSIANGAAESGCMVDGKNYINVNVGRGTGFADQSCVAPLVAVLAK